MQGRAGYAVPACAFGDGKPALRDSAVRRHGLFDIHRPRTADFGASLPCRLKPQHRVLTDHVTLELGDGGENVAYNSCA